MSRFTPEEQAERERARRRLRSALVLLEGDDFAYVKSARSVLNAYVHMIDFDIGPDELDPDEAADRFQTINPKVPYVDLAHTVRAIDAEVS